MTENKDANSEIKVESEKVNIGGDAVGGNKIVESGTRQEVTVKTEPEKSSGLNVMGILGIVGLIILAVLALIFGPRIQNSGLAPSPNLGQSSASNIYDKTLPIESIVPMKVAFYQGVGDSNIGKGWSSLSISYTENSPVGYVLDYTLPDEGYGYAGLAFDFPKPQDFTKYAFIEVTVEFIDKQARTNLYLKDISNEKTENLDYVPIGLDVPSNNGVSVSTYGTKQTLRVDLHTRFSHNIAQSAIRQIAFDCTTETSRGHHTFTVSDIKLVNP